MKIRNIIFVFSVLFFAPAADALQPDEILVIANGDIAESVGLAQYYCAGRGVPVENILVLPLGKGLDDLITRDEYTSKIAEPVRKKLVTPEFGFKIRCLLTTYGVPIKVAGRGPLNGKEQELAKLRQLAQQEKNSLELPEHNNTAVEPAEIKRRLANLQSEIDRISGSETGASVDSELSMVLRENYELYRWQLNPLKDNVTAPGFNTLMVSRLDGPGCQIAKGLIDKAIKAENEGLKGAAYIDSRGIANDQRPYSLGYFDKSLRDLAILTQFRTSLTVKQERTDELFPPGSCPQTAIYCGWYSLKKYVDAFDFVDGAIGFHISSLEAVDLRDPNSSQWCPAMLKDGITATLGAVAEPYLHAFPEPRAFFLELYNGRSLIEAYYHTNPFNSWQLVLIGDPLYTPFKRTSAESRQNNTPKQGSQ